MSQQQSVDPAADGPPTLRQSLADRVERILADLAEVHRLAVLHESGKAITDYTTAARAVAVYGKDLGE